jgi:hypothetical protein
MNTPKTKLDSDKQNLANFTPTKEQINALACRLLPEIKKFFADEQVQKEFAEWQARQNTAE